MKSEQNNGPILVILVLALLVIGGLFNPLGEFRPFLMLQKPTLDTIPDDIKPDVPHPEEFFSPY